MLHAVATHLRINLQEARSGFGLFGRHSHTTVLAVKILNIGDIRSNHNPVYLCPRAMVSYRYRLLDYAPQAVQRAVHSIIVARKIISRDRIVGHSGRAKLSKRRENPPCKTLRSKPQRRDKKQPVLVSEASSTGRASDQYCLTMVTSTGSSCDQYWLLSHYRESPSDSRATPLPPALCNSLFYRLRG